jgi:hypothetical protein
MDSLILLSKMESSLGSSRAEARYGTTSKVPFSFSVQKSFLSSRLTDRKDCSKMMKF